MILRLRHLVSLLLILSQLLTPEISAAAEAMCRKQTRTILFQEPLYDINNNRLMTADRRPISAGVGGVRILGAHPSNSSVCYVQIGSTIGYLSKAAIDFPQSTQARSGLCPGGCGNSSRTAQAAGSSIPQALPVQTGASGAGNGYFRIQYEKTQWYVSRIMANLSKGYLSDANACAKSVRLILEGAGLLPRGAYRGMVVENGAAQAQHYWKLLAANGWKNDWTQCFAPGAVRVYKPGPEARARVRAGNGSAGDKWGHIEIVGSDGGFHFGARNYVPMDHPTRLGTGRRQLTHCMIYKGG